MDFLLSHSVIKFRLNYCTPHLRNNTGVSQSGTRQQGEVTHMQVEQVELRGEMGGQSASGYKEEADAAVVKRK